MAVVERKPWNDETTNALLNELKRQQIYITNLVKCAQPKPDLPSRTVIKEDLPLLAAELTLVDPRIIVTFGQLPFRVLTGRSILLRECYEDLCRKRLPGFSWNSENGKQVPVMPSYFPTGRGNPTLAASMLRIIREIPQA